MQLLELVLCFLPVVDKLLELTRLSSTFPLLTAACFSEDSLEVSEPVGWNERTDRPFTSQSCSVQALLSRIRHLRVYAEPWHQRRPLRVPALAQPAWLPVGVGGFSRLQSLSIRLQEGSWYEWDGQEEDRPLDLQRVLTPLSSLPLLHSLSIEADAIFCFRRTVRCSDVALLSRLPSLRSLTVGTIPLAVGSLSLLCSLPLQHLSMGRATLGLDSEVDEQTQTAAVAPQPGGDVSFSLRRLLLPAMRTVKAEAEVRRVLEAYGILRIDRSIGQRPRQPVQLELVRVNDAGIEELQPLLWWIPSLTALRLSVCPGMSLLPQPASAGLRLPQLQCVSLQIYGPVHRQYEDEHGDDNDVNAARRRDWLPELAAECVSFLHSYSGQLLRLEMTGLPNLPAAAPILQAILRCQQLRHLTLQAGDGQGLGNFAAVSFHPLPQLHTLHLIRADLSTAQLASLLRACPAVEHIVLGEMPTFTLDLLPAFGRSCRHLKRLEFNWSAGTQFSQPVQPELTAAEQAGSDAVFPQLVALTVRIHLSERAVVPTAPPQSVQWLLRLLQSAPLLRFLRLDLVVDLSKLLPLSSLTALRGFRLRHDWPPWLQSFFHSTRGHSRSVLDSTSSQLEHEADAELELASAFRSMSALFRDDVERFGGRTGRKAFFAAIEARLAGERDELESKGEQDCSSNKAVDEDGQAEDEAAGSSCAAADEEEEMKTEASEEEEEEEEGAARGRKRQRAHGM